MNDEEMQRRATVAEIMDHRRETDATVCVVVERTDTWKWIVFAFASGFVCDWLIRLFL